MKANPDLKKRCSKCGAVLALERSDGFEVCRRDVQLVASDRVSIVCYRCNLPNVFVHPNWWRTTTAAS